MSEMRLILIRHAKSSWDEAGLADAQRPLAPRGRRAAVAMGERLQAIGESCELLLCSPAQRAQQTAERLRCSWRLAPEPTVLDELYTFNADRLQSVLSSQAWPAQRLAVVGHNPAFEDWLARVPGLAGLRVPTAQVCCLRVSVPAWLDVGPEVCRLLHYDYPKNEAGWLQQPA